MAGFNKVVLVGNLTKDPESKANGSGSTLCEFSLAYNERYTKASGEKVEKVHFFDVVAWRKTADLVIQYLKKGSQVLVEGTLSQDRWQDQSTGQNRSRVRITAQRVVFMGGKRDGEHEAVEGAGEDGAGF